MKKALRILAVIILLAAVGFWAAKGGDRGWTINNIRHDTMDPVTGLSGVTWERVFIPGCDFLAAAALVAGVMAAASFLFRSKKAQN